MAKHEVDTDQMISDSTRIKELLANLDQLLTDYVKRIQKVPTETKEWQGNAADNFVTLVKNDYTNNHLLLMNNIRKYADELNMSANEYINISQSNV